MLKEQSIKKATIIFTNDGENSGIERHTEGFSNYEIIGFMRLTEDILIEELRAKRVKEEGGDKD